MEYRELKVINKLGLHARAAAKLASLAGKFASQITLEFGKKSVNAKSIMGVMLLAAGNGSIVILKVTGADELDAANAVDELFQKGFDEEILESV